MKNIAYQIGQLIGFYVALLMITLYFVFSSWLFIHFWNWFLDDTTNITMTWGVSFAVNAFYYVYLTLSGFYKLFLEKWQLHINAINYSSMLKYGVIKVKE